MNNKKQYIILDYSDTYKCHRIIASEGKDAKAIYCDLFADNSLKPPYENPTKGVHEDYCKSLIGRVIELYDLHPYKFIGINIKFVE